MSGKARVSGSLTRSVPARCGCSLFRWTCARFSGLCVLLTIGVVGAATAVAQEPPVTKPEQAVRAYVTNYAGDGISVIDPYRGAVVAEIRTGTKPHGVAVAPDGTAVYVSNEGDGTLSIIDPGRNSVVATVPVGKEPNQLEVSADGRYVFVTLHGQDALAVIDARRREVVDSVPVGRHPHIALRSPDGNTVYVTSEGDMKLVAVDATTHKPQFEVPLFGWPRVLAVSADGRTGYQTMRWLNGTLVIDFETQRVVDRIAFAMPTFAPEGKDAHGSALTPDGAELWLTTQTSNDVAVIRTGDRQLLRRIPVGQDPNWIAFTPDGQLAVVSNTASNDVSVIDATRYSVVGTIAVGRSPKRLAVGSVQTPAAGLKAALDAEAQVGLSATTTRRWDFDEATPGAPPSGWLIEGTNQRGALADWAIQARPDAPSLPHVLVLTDPKDNSGGTFNLSWTDDVRFSDGVIEVSVKADSGREDQGGGPIWRAQDKDNYYIARWNPLEDNFRLYAVKQGSRKMLESAKVQADPQAWHRIRIEHDGDEIRCHFDGRALFTVRDGTFADPGGVGVWTKADAATSFDDFVVMPREPGKDD